MARYIFHRSHSLEVGRRPRLEGRSPVPPGMAPLRRTLSLALAQESERRPLCRALCEAHFTTHRAPSQPLQPAVLAAAAARGREIKQRGAANEKGASAQPDLKKIMMQLFSFVHVTVKREKVFAKEKNNGF